MTGGDIPKNIWHVFRKFVQNLCRNGVKKRKCLKIKHFLFAFVGITGLEPATSRPPDVCATNCAKSRFCVAKVYTFDDNSKLLSEIFLKNSKNVLFPMLYPCFT